MKSIVAYLAIVLIHVLPCFLSSQCLSWKNVKVNGSSGTSVIAVSPADSSLFLAQHGVGFFEYRRNGQWSNNLISNLNNSINTVDIDNNGVLYISVEGSGSTAGVHRSADKGKTWSRISNGLPPLGGPQSLSVSANGSLLVCAGTWNPGEGIYTSSNGGQSWTFRQGRFSPDNAWSSLPVGHFLFSGGNIYLAAAHQGVLKSTDGGITWSRKNKGLYLYSNGNPDAVNIIVGRGDTLFIGINSIATPGITKGGIYRSIDGAETWEQVPFLALNQNVVAMVVHKDSLIANAGEGNTYTERGVWKMRLQNIGQWTTVDEQCNINNTVSGRIRYLCYEKGSDTLYAATHQGVFCYPGRITTDTKDEYVQSLSSFFLHPHAGTLSLHLVAASLPRSLRLYTLGGNIISTHTIPAGAERVDIDTHSLVAGIYIAQITDADGQCTANTVVVYER